MINSGTGALVFASRRIESIFDGEGQLSDGRCVIDHASQFSEMGNEMHVIGSKQVIDKKLERQTVLYAGFVYG